MGSDTRSDRHLTIFRVVEVAILCSTTIFVTLKLQEHKDAFSSDRYSNTLAWLPLITLIAPVTDFLVNENVARHDGKAGRSLILFAPFYQFCPRPARSQGVAVGALLLPGLYAATVAWQLHNSNDAVSLASWQQSALVSFTLSFIGVAHILASILISRNRSRWSTPKFAVMVSIFITVVVVLSVLLPAVALSTGISVGGSDWHRHVTHVASGPAATILVYLFVQFMVSGTAPRTFTVGENLIVVQALTIATLTVLQDALDPAPTPTVSALSNSQLTAQSAISAGLLMAAVMGLSLPVGQKFICGQLERLLCRNDEEGKKSRILQPNSISRSLPHWVPSAVFWVLLALELSAMVFPFLSFRLQTEPLAWIFEYMVRRSPQIACLAPVLTFCGLVLIF